MIKVFYKEEGDNHNECCATCKLLLLKRRHYSTRNTRISIAFSDVVGVLNILDKQCKSSIISH